MRLTDGQIEWLKRLSETGTWPDRPFVRDSENSVPLMQAGLVELIKPPAPYLPYAAITPAGRNALQQSGGPDAK